MSNVVTTGAAPGGGRNLASIISQLGKQSALAKQSVVDPRALAAGIKPSFAVVTFKGKTWGVRHRGVTHQLLARDQRTGQVLGSIPTIDLVILKSAAAISKTYYIDKYKEGDFKQPDCWSTNGIAPDAGAPKKQSITCKGCQWDAFGSRTMDDGRKGKACQDNKRLAVVPAADMRNEAYGGPMMLRLPPSAFNGLSELEMQLHQQGYDYFAVVMRLSFDHEVAFPKVIFTPIAVLGDDQMAVVLELQKNELVDRILSEELNETTGDPNQASQETDPGVESSPPPDPARAQQQADRQFGQPHHGHAPDVVITPPPQPVATPVVQAFNPAPPPPDPQPGSGDLPPPPQAAATAAFQMAAPASQQGPVQGNADGLDIPAHLRRDHAQVATPAPAPAPVATPVAETPEQTIARLQAELAAAKTAPRPRKKRTDPVTPAGNVTGNGAGQPLPLATTTGTQPVPLTSAQPLASGFPGEPIVPDDADEGDMPADLDDRINSLLNPGSS